MQLLHVYLVPHLSYLDNACGVTQLIVLMVVGCSTGLPVAGNKMITDLLQRRCL